jgi:hypothetical protein
MSVTVPALTETQIPKINQAIQQLASGRSNAFGTVTLAVAPATSTTVTDRNCGTDTVPSLTPTTANAAAALATMFIPTTTIINGAFVIQHSSSAAVDRTFRYAIHG